VCAMLALHTAGTYTAFVLKVSFEYYGGVFIQMR